MTFICLYRVIREEISIFCKVVVSVIVKIIVHMNMCIILNVYRNGVFESQGPGLLDFSLG